MLHDYLLPVLNVTHTHPIPCTCIGQTKAIGNTCGDTLKSKCVADTSDSDTYIVTLTILTAVKVHVNHSYLLSSLFIGALTLLINASEV